MADRLGWVVARWVGFAGSFAGALVLELSEAAGDRSVAEVKV